MSSMEFRAAFLAVGFVIATTITKSLNQPFVMNVFEPLRIQSSPSRLATVRIPIKGDGHCLPRAIFRGAKSLNLLPNFIIYSGLLKLNALDYMDFLVEAIDIALGQLDDYEKDNGTL